MVTDTEYEVVPEVNTRRADFTTSDTQTLWFPTLKVVFFAELSVATSNSKIRSRRARWTDRQSAAAVIRRCSHQTAASMQKVLPKEGFGKDPALRGCKSEGIGNHIGGKPVGEFQHGECETGPRPPPLDRRQRRNKIAPPVRGDRDRYRKIEAALGLMENFP